MFEIRSFERSGELVTLRSQFREFEYDERDGREEEDSSSLGK